MKKVKDKSTIADLANLVISKQLDRIERMLRWLVIQGELEINHQDRLGAGKAQNKDWFEACVENRKKIRGQLPDISDIIEEKK